MSGATGIEWTDATWNPIRGCSRVSEGCRNCYAEKVAYRFSDEGAAYHGLVGIGGKWNGQIKFIEEHLLDPLRWKKPRRIFVNSMSDLFHENVTDEMLDRIFAVMALAPQHTFQVLTKRPERMLRYLSAPNRADYVQHPITDLCLSYPRDLVQQFGGKGWGGFPLRNVWLGVSVENQKAADERIPMLLQTPAAVRFLSVEPLLGPVDLTPSWINPTRQNDNPVGWVIVGGESGPGARPMHPDWARGLRDQCVAAGVPFFFKQWGEWVPWQADGGYSEWKSQAGKLMDRHGFPDFKVSDVKGWSADLLLAGDENAVHQRVGKKAAGRLLDGREWNEFPGVTA